MIQHVRIQRGTGSGPTLKINMFSEQYRSGSPEILKATKPEFNVGTPAKLRFAGGQELPDYSGIWILSPKRKISGGKTLDPRMYSKRR